MKYGLLPLSGLFLCFYLLEARSQRHGPRICEKITIPMCKDIGYNETYMPNQFNHDSQEEAGLEVHQFWPLVKIQCSVDLKFFLCSMYAPICMESYDKPLPACRSVCERAKAGCAPLMKQYGFPWPERMNCDNLPRYGDKDRLCMDFNVSTTSVTTTLPPKLDVQPGNKMTKDHKTNIPFPKDDGALSNVDRENDCQCSCRTPLILLNTTSVYYDNVQAAGISNCAMTCTTSYFSLEAINFATFWIGAWSVLCCVSTLMTVITYLIDIPRFLYPEKPIIFLSACYLMVSIGYIIRLLAGREAVGCEEDVVRHESTAPTLCTIVFLLTYFFGMAACIWWVVLSLTWFLAAGLKWGQEAISSYSQYFHLIAWLIPSVKTITILAMSGVDGDSVTGMCYVGNHSATSLWAFVLGPLLVYLLVGLCFLSAGFISLFRIRDVIKQQGEQKTEKLEKLIMKIGVFSVLYTVPAVIVIACYLYELYYRDSWDLSIACPCLSTPVKPAYSVFMVKYFMNHVIELLPVSGYGRVRL